MPVYKDKKRNTWYVRFPYRDLKGKKKEIWKRGFKTKGEASKWETDNKNKTNLSLDMTLNDFADIYLDYMEKRIKLSTIETKRNIVKNRILPYLGSKKLRDLDAKDVICWQNEMIDFKDRRGNGFTKSYLKTLHNQLSAILNHAIKYYDLPKNPAAIVGNMGNDKEVKINFWTYEEYKKFSEAIMDKPLYYYAFEVLYWCGIREGELLALVPSDFDFKNKTLSITKTYHLIKGKEIVTSPKTKKSIRKIAVPDFLIEEIKDYLKMIYEPQENQRLFPISKCSLCAELRKGCKKAGVKKIRVHDIRHSHVSLLIQQGYSAVAIADRVGHESIEITYKYAHLFPTAQKDMASTLDSLKGGDNNG